MTGPAELATAISTALLAAQATDAKDYPGMLNSLTGMSTLTVMEVVGPLVLAAALIWGIVHTRGRTRAQRASTDAATARLYDQEEAARRRQHQP